MDASLKVSGFVDRFFFYLLVARAAFLLLASLAAPLVAGVARLCGGIVVVRLCKRADLRRDLVVTGIPSFVS